MSADKERVAFIDILRCTACFFVIINHTVTTEISYHSYGTAWLMLIAFFFLSKTAVPIFIMITGSLLLPKEEPFSKVFVRIGRIITVLFLGAVVYQLSYFGMKNGPVSSIKTMILNVLQDGISNEFWYLYLYIGILIMMPLLRKMRANMRKEDYQYFLFISFLVNGVYPLLTIVFPVLNTVAYVNVALFDGYLGFLFFGDFVRRYNFFSEKKNSLLALNILLLMIALCSYISAKSYISMGQNYLWLDNVTLATTAVPACCFFILVRNCIKIRSDGKQGRFFTQIGKCTFAMYLLSDLIILRMKCIYIFLRKTVSGIPALLIYEITVYFVCYFIARLLRSLPGIKRLL